MQSDDNIQTTLSKWPFILGDILLVASALAIAILGDWQLSNWQVASCVISVALGAALFVLPYIVEFQVRIREEAEDRNADLRILKRRIVSVQEQVEAVVERMESFEAGLDNTAYARPDLSGSIQALEIKIDPINKEQSKQSGQLKDLANQVQALANSVEAKLGISSAKEIEYPQLEMATEEKAKKPKKAALVDANSDKIIAKKTRASRKPRTPEPRLLERAIDQKQDKSSEAVSRIIKSKSKKLPQEEAPAVEPAQEAPKKKIKQTSNVNKSKEPSAQTGEPNVKTEPIADEASKSLDEKINPAVVQLDAEESEPIESKDMFGDVVPSQVKKRVRIKKSDSSIVASVFIGIGNKPYVRGSGAGLNWDKGIAMEFVEIGKWQWTPPTEFKESIELQLFRNDEDADSTGKYTLEPGQQLDLSPVF